MRPDLTINIDGYIYLSEGSLGPCKARGCEEPGLYFDDNGDYWCEDHLIENHQDGRYDEDEDYDDESDPDDDDDSFFNDDDE